MPQGKGSAKEVGQLRYAAVDALLPLAGALAVLAVGGARAELLYIAAGVGLVLALARLRVYVGQ